MIGLTNNKMDTMSSSRTYQKMHGSSIEAIMDCIVDRIEKDKICPVCRVECNIHSGKTKIVYDCPRCRQVRVTLI